MSTERLSSRYPIRQFRPSPIPPAREFMRRCRRCTADFMALAPGKTGERGIWSGWEWYCSQECWDARRSGR